MPGITYTMPANLACVVINILSARCAHAVARVHISMGETVPAEFAPENYMPVENPAVDEDDDETVLDPWDEPETEYDE